MIDIIRAMAHQAEHALGKALRGAEVKVKFKVGTELYAVVTEVAEEDGHEWILLETAVPLDKMPGIEIVEAGK